MPLLAGVFEQARETGGVAMRVPCSTVERPGHIPTARIVLGPEVMNTRSDRPIRTRPTPALRPAALLASALALAFGAMSPHAAGGGIYRTTQPDGTVVFTDQPVPDSTLIESLPLNVVGTGGAQASSANGRPGSADVPSDGDRPASESGDDAGADERDAAAGIPIERVEIASPPPDATIIDPVGAILVEVGTAPGTLAASRLVAEAVVDGEVVARGTSPIAVPPLDRGEHRLAVRLVDTDGRVVVESATQALYVRRSFVRPSDEDRNGDEVGFD